MSKDRTPIRTVEELDQLDHAEIVEGYMDGAEMDHEPGDNRSRAYWHGWRNRQVDCRRAEPDEAMAALASDIMKNGGFMREKGQTGPDMRRETRLARQAMDQGLPATARRRARQERSR